MFFSLSVLLDFVRVFSAVGVEIKSGLKERTYSSHEYCNSLLYCNSDLATMSTKYFLIDPETKVEESF